jgi:hypothetical protein
MSDFYECFFKRLAFLHFCTCDYLKQVKFDGEFSTDRVYAIYTIIPEAPIVLDDANIAELNALGEKGWRDFVQKASELTMKHY